MMRRRPNASSDNLYLNVHVQSPALPELRRWHAAQTVVPAALGWGLAHNAASLPSAASRFACAPARSRASLMGSKSSTTIRAVPGVVELRVLVAD